MRGVFQTSVYRQLLTYFTTNLISKPTDISIPPTTILHYFLNFLLLPL